MTRLPKIVGDTWFNSKPFTEKDLEGKVVLADFWTYSCVNCQRMLPYIKEWWAKYKDKGLVIIGIHTPEFDFEKITKNVEQAVKDLGVEWPVVMDSDYINWNNFANHYWPAKYLADKNGKIVYTHFGEGNYAETEAAIRAVLMEGASSENMPKISEEHGRGGVCFVATPETYCGYERGSIENSGGYVYDSAADYAALKTLSRDSIALNGKFIARPEFVESAAEGAALLLRFSATEVNLVLHAVGEWADVEIMLDGKPVPAEIRGRDISEAGEVKIQAPTLYNLLKSAGLVEGVLTIRAKSGNFRAYAFTFSGCA